MVLYGCKKIGKEIRREEDALTAVHLLFYAEFTVCQIFSFFVKKQGILTL
jgi:hypothetical protein